MTRDPFDEFNEIEKMFRKVMNGEDFMFGGSSQGISVKRIGNETKVEVHGDVSEEEIERLKSQYPDAEISVNGEKIEDTGPVEVVDEEDKEKREPSKGEVKDDDTIIEEVDEEELPPQELALKRFREEKEES